MHSQGVGAETGARRARERLTGWMLLKSGAPPGFPVASLTVHDGFWLLPCGCAKFHATAMVLPAATLNLLVPAVAVLLPHGVPEFLLPLATVVPSRCTQTPRVKRRSRGVGGRGLGKFFRGRFRQHPMRRDQSLSIVPLPYGEDK